MKNRFGQTPTKITHYPNGAVGIYYDDGCIGCGKFDCECHPSESFSDANRRRLFKAFGWMPVTVRD